MTRADCSPGLEVDIQASSTDLPKPADAEICRWLENALAFGLEEYAGQPQQACEVSVRIVAEAESQALNADYRGKDRPTNVLSFPVGAEFAGLAPADMARPLGDLVLCAPVIEREAQEQGKMAAAHWAHMLTHGLLHLLGYDHEDDEQALTMEGLEIRALKVLGFADPYQSHDSI